MATYKDVLMLIDKVSEPLRKIQNNTEKLKEKFSKLKSGVKKVAGVLATVGSAISVAGGAILRASNQYAEMGDRIDKMSQKIGMSRKAFQEWDYIMSQNGGSVESLQMGFKTLTTQIEGVQKGSKDSVNAFNALGVSVKDANGQFRSQDEIFNDTIRKLQQIKNPTQKAMLANRLFGRSAAELRPLLNQEAEAVDNLRDKANKMGLVISDEDVENAVKFKDTMDTFTRFFQAKFGTVMMKLMPSFSKALEEIIAFSQENQEVFNDMGIAFNFIVTKALPSVLRGVFGVANAFRSLGGIIGNVIGWIVSIPTNIQTAFINAQNIILRIFIALKRSIGDAIQYIVERLALMLQTIGAIAGKIPGLKGLGDAITDIGNGITSNSVRQTQNNNTVNNSTTIKNYYGGQSTMQNKPKKFNTAYVAP